MNLPPTDEETVSWPWRVGRKVGRTIYCHRPGATDGEPAYDGYLIGVMDSLELAEDAVHWHNHAYGYLGKSRSDVS